MIQIGSNLAQSLVEVVLHFNLGAFLFCKGFLLTGNLLPMAVLIF